MPSRRLVMAGAGAAAILAALLVVWAWATITLYRNRKVYRKIANVTRSPTAAQRVILRNQFDQHVEIPRIIHITLQDKRPDFVTRKLRSIQAAYPLWDVRVYDNDDCMAFIERHFETVVSHAYRKINPKYGAMRADFFRYCVLYVTGGFYMDVTLALPGRHLDTYDRMAEDAYLVPLPGKDRYRQRKLKHVTMYEQWAFMFKPRHPYLKTVIEHVVHDIMDSVVPPYDRDWLDMLTIGSEHCSPGKHAVLATTGPDAFSRHIHRYTQAHGIKHGVLDMERKVDNKLKRAMYAGRRHYSAVEEPIYL